MYYFTSNKWFHKIFDNGRKNMSFMIEDYSISFKYSDIWNKTK